MAIQYFITNKFTLLKCTNCNYFRSSLSDKYQPLNRINSLSAKGYRFYGALKNELTISLNSSIFSTGT